MTKPTKEEICSRRDQTEKDVRELLSKIQRRYKCQTKTAQDIIIAIVSYVNKK